MTRSSWNRFGTRRAQEVAAVALAAFVATAAHVANACTTFCVVADGRVLFGRNYDFPIRRALVMTNPRRLTKTGHRPDGPVWTARHGSVTFNQFGREFPMGGMNEAGLVVELMWLDETQYPAADTRAPLDPLEWIQFQLDTAATVDEVLTSDTRVRIEGDVPLHYFVSDAAGGRATIEFLRGQLVAHTGRELSIPALANSTYAESLVAWRNDGVQRDSSSTARFSRVAQGIPQFATAAGPAVIERAFALLLSTAQRETRWSIVYDQTLRLVHFRTDRHPAVRLITMKEINFSCEQPARTLDVHAPLAGDVTTAMNVYSEAANRALVNASYYDFRLYRFASSPSEIERVITRPARGVCS